MEQLPCALRFRVVALASGVSESPPWLSCSFFETSHSVLIGAAAMMTEVNGSLHNDFSLENTPHGIVEAAQPRQKSQTLVLLFAATSVQRTQSRGGHM